MLFLKKTLLLISLILPNLSFTQASGSMLRENPPLWEAGLGVIGVSVPDYPGAAQSTFHTIPIPTFIYRGERVRADEDGGIRARFIKGADWEFSLSIAGSLPSNSENNVERRGMPDLDTMAEVGPTFIWKIIKPSKDNPHKLILSLPIRLAVSSDLKSLNTRGITLNPVLVYMRERFFLTKLTLFAGLDLRLASDTMMDYFYSVAPEFSNANRAAYEARAGYLGTSVSLGMSYILKNNYSFFAGLHHMSLHGAKNAKSPMLVKTTNTAVAAGVIWWLWESDRKSIR